jgi:DnaJ-class molecular chaperone
MRKNENGGNGTAARLMVEEDEGRVGIDTGDMVVRVDVQAQAFRRRNHADRRTIILGDQ